MSHQDKDPEVREIRIIIVGGAGLMNDLLEDIIEQDPDMIIVGRLPTPDTLAEEVDRSHADVAILNLQTQAVKAVCGPLLRARPDLAVVSLADEGRALVRCELVPRIVNYGEATFDRLMDILRRSVAGSSG